MDSRREGGRSRSANPSSTSPIHLFDEDPELAARLSPAERDRAWRYAVAEVVTVPRGVHDPSRIGSPDLLGLLVLDGLLIRTVDIAERRSGELVGPRDLLRPWDSVGKSAPMPFEVGWRVLSPVTLALLDRRMTKVAARWPAVMHELIRRAVQRSHMVAFNLAVHCLQHVELRLLALLWHLADRFGRVTSEGTLVPLALSHRDLAELTGSQRPSVSSNLSKLADRGQVTRQPDRTWLLHDDPPVDLRDLRARASQTR